MAIKVGQPQTSPDKPSHTPGVREGNSTADAQRGHLQLVSFDRPQLLQKDGSSTFVPPAGVNAGPAPTTTRVVQGAPAGIAHTGGQFLADRTSQILVFSLPLYTSRLRGDHLCLLGGQASGITLTEHTTLGNRQHI